MIGISSTNHSDGVDTIYDVIHGNIDLADIDHSCDGQIRQLLRAPFMQRLRRIKQLGFVSQNFLGAEHNRYSHALGTMQMMRSIIRRLDTQDAWAEIISGVNILYQNVNGTNRESSPSLQSIQQHLLVAALVQDVGELPYAKSSTNIFVPATAASHFVRQRCAFSDAQCDDKDIFTLSTIWRDSNVNYFDGLNSTLLSFLVSEQLPHGMRPNPGLKALYHMLDGEIDADRLDYVYRDAYHTIGAHGAPQPIIDSIVCYDENGPILEHIRPVSDFFVTRALLWSTVYLSPENRFRTILLRKALRDLREMASTELSEERLKPYFREGLDSETFEKFDDYAVDGLVRTAATGVFGQKARQVSEQLVHGKIEYEYRWVSVPKNPRKSGKPFELPDHFFFDIYSDYEEHSLYDAGNVRVKGARYDKVGGIVPLESCVGAFTKLLKEDWSPLPMEDHMVWFGPKDRRLKASPYWNVLLDENEVSQEVIDALGNDDIMSDVLNYNTCDESTPGPCIFLKSENGISPLNIEGWNYFREASAQYNKIDGSPTEAKRNLKGG